jgi:hypothetical protein
MANPRGNATRYLVRSASLHPRPTFPTLRAVATWAPVQVCACEYVCGYACTLTRSVCGADVHRARSRTHAHTHTHTLYACTRTQCVYGHIHRDRERDRETQTHTCSAMFKSAWATFHPPRRTSPSSCLDSLRHPIHAAKQNLLAEFRGLFSV